MAGKTIFISLALVVLVAADNSGYGAPAGGSGPAASGYGPPAGGSGPPAAGYGPPANGGGYGGPIYTYGQQGNNGGGGAGGLGGFAAGLFTAKAAALKLLGVGLLGFLVFTTINPTVTVTGGRKKREAIEEFIVGNSTNPDQVSALYNLIDQFGLENASQLQKDMVAKYLECSDPGQGEASLTGCIERLACMYNDKSDNMEESEREVVGLILSSFLNNEFLTPEYRRRLQMAGQMGHNSQGSCHKFLCHHELIHGETVNSKPKKISKKDFWKKINY